MLTAALKWALQVRLAGGSIDVVLEESLRVVDVRRLRHESVTLVFTRASFCIE